MESAVRAVSSLQIVSYLDEELRVGSWLMVEFWQKEELLWPSYQVEKMHEASYYSPKHLSWVYRTQILMPLELSGLEY